jgi:hypothetical protein
MIQSALQLHVFPFFAEAGNQADSSQLQALPGHESAVRLGGKRRLDVGDQGTIGEKLAALGLLVDLGDAKTDFSSHGCMRFQFFRTHVDEDLPADERKAASLWKCFGLGPGAKAVKIQRTERNFEIVFREDQMGRGVLVPRDRSARLTSLAQGKNAHMPPRLSGSTSRILATG